MGRIAMAAQNILADSSMLAKKFYRRLKYWSITDGFKMGKYWEDRLGNYKFDLRGVGNCNLSAKENKNSYEKAEETFLCLCNECFNDDLKALNVLDIGCGSGFYTDFFKRHQVEKYMGVDVTDVLFKELREKHPSYIFKKLDVTKTEMDGHYDLIIMIDVTQHITTKKGFKYAMANIRKHLNDNGVFIVTSWLDKKARSRFYEVSRKLLDYRKEFENYIFSEPKIFRDKYIFSIKK
jgi:2-polyprenyl-3-methyl-5-hydroxy-6-metoxy-1,4-benzoquinol methylase